MIYEHRRSINGQCAITDDNGNVTLSKIVNIDDEKSWDFATAKRTETFDDAKEQAEAEINSL